MRYPRRLTLACLVLAGAAALVAPAAAPAQATPETACLGELGARCATVSVPTDHDGRVAGRERIAYARLPATGTKTGTLVFLSGGPGEAAIPLAPLLALAFGELRDRYDLLIPDQRGTGESGEVECGDVTDARDVAACAERLGPRRAFLTTRETAFDLEDLRVALGDEQLTLLGVSYGTKVAAEYARRFPQRTAGLVLDSPTPVDGLDGVSELRQLGLPRVLREICFPGPCRGAVRDAPAALSTLARRLQRAPLRGTLVATNGRARRATLTEADLYELVLLADLDPFLRGDLPAAVASGVLGDATPMLRLVADARRRLIPVLSEGVGVSRLLATACLEGRLPWSPDAPLAGREATARAALAARGTAAFAPFRPQTVLGASLLAPCAAWPPTPRPEGVPNAGPAVPTLVLAGREDLRTPLEDARRTAAQYPGAQLLAVPDAGHAVLGADLGGCALEAVGAFLAGRPVAPCRRRARRPLPAAAVIPADLDDVRPAPGSRGRPGRTATAVAATLYGVERAAVAGALFGDGPVRVPGLRGGVAIVRERVTTLRDVEWVRGVLVSGRLSRRSARLRVSGAQAAPGTLARGRGRTLRGALGGEGLAVRPPSVGG